MSLSSTARHRLALFALGFVILSCLSLSRWQWQRGNYKKSLEQSLKQRSEEPALTVQELLTLPFETLRYRIISLPGEWVVGSDLLLENQQQKGQVGYRLFTAVQFLNSQKLLWVERGFIPQGASYKILPQIDLVQGPTSVQGVIDHLPSPLALAPFPTAPAFGPWRVPSFEVKALEQHFKQGIFPFVAIQKAQPLPLSWQRHLGYALQWFTMAAVALIYLGIVIKNRAKKCKV
jgi:surfeit locus 1 family protein